LEFQQDVSAGEVRVKDLHRPEAIARFGTPDVHCNASVHSDLRCGQFTALLNASFGFLHQVRHALTFPGGGAHGVGPGQFTDDGELALCLARGLASAPPPEFPAAAVAAQYAAWLAGPPGPFDVGECSLVSDETSMTATGRVINTGRCNTARLPAEHVSVCSHRC
jgi:ADP-ribosylglycohydrolase